MDKGHKVQDFLRQYLDPTDRLDELLFGLIMVLSITLGASLAADAASGTSALAWTILSCNLAWGLIDGGMYIVTSLFTRGRQAKLMQTLNSARNPDEQLATIGAALDDRLASLTSPEERHALYLKIAERLLGKAVPQTHVIVEDLYGALATLWLTILASIPALAPFLFYSDRFTAARVSNALVLLSLFVVGFLFSRECNANPWRLGLATVIFGAIMVAIVISLGG